MFLFPLSPNSDIAFLVSPGAGDDSLPIASSSRAVLPPIILPARRVGSSAGLQLELDAVRAMIVRTQLEVSLAQERLASLYDRKAALEKRFGKSS